MGDLLTTVSPMYQKSKQPRQYALDETVAPIVYASVFAPGESTCSCNGL